MAQDNSTTVKIKIDQTTDKNVSNNKISMKINRRNPDVQDNINVKITVSNMICSQTGVNSNNHHPNENNLGLHNSGHVGNTDGGSNMNQSKCQDDTSGASSNGTTHAPLGYTSADEDDYMDHSGRDEHTNHQLHGLQTIGTLGVSSGETANQQC